MIVFSKAMLSVNEPCLQPLNLEVMQLSPKSCQKILRNTASRIQQALIHNSLAVLKLYSQCIYAQHSWSTVSCF